MSVKIGTLSHKQISTLTLGEPLRAPRALSHHGATRCASARSRRAIRSITFALHGFAVSRFGGSATIPLATNVSKKAKRTPKDTLRFFLLSKNGLSKRIMN
jgi:hypothetical protein